MNKVCLFNKSTKRQNLHTLATEVGSRKIKLAGTHFWKYTVYILIEEDWEKQEKY